MARPRTPLLQRILNRTFYFNNHWLLPAGSNGYSFVKTGGKGIPQLGHRVTYELFIGEIPEGMELDHLCRIRNCVNPYHLEAVTRQVNQHRGNSVSGINSRKTHCIRGHELSGANLYVPPKRPDRRYCRACQTLRDRRVAS